jgi:hypothetical protein
LRRESPATQAFPARWSRKPEARAPVKEPTTLATLPPACEQCIIVYGDAYYVCNGARLAPRLGNNGVYDVVVNPL